MDGIRKGVPVDQKTWTILNGDKSLSTSRIPGAYWRDNQVRFFDDLPENCGDRARFRFSVGGEVLIY